jgi:hypothetical protein
VLGTRHQFGAPGPLDVVDEIVEGDAIASITFEKEEKPADDGYATPGSMRIVPATA